jgi:hypothetical protein
MARRLSLAAFSMQTSGVLQDVRISRHPIKSRLGEKTIAPVNAAA